METNTTARTMVFETMENCEDFEGICRICLGSEEYLQSVFMPGNNISSDNPLPLFEMINSLTTVKITNGDGLPEKICPTCANRTVNMYLFKLQCERSDKILRDRLEKILKHQQQTSSEQPEQRAPLKDEIKIYQVPILDDFGGEFDIESYGSEDIFKEENEIKKDIEINEEKLFAEKETKKFSCELCHKDFSRLDLLMRHNIAHAVKMEYNEEKQMDDEENGIADVFQTNRKIKQEEMFSCNECDKNFNQKEDLDHHTHNTHNNETKGHSCQICGKRFAKLWHKSRHLKTAHGDKQYKCSTCNKIFSRKDQFNCHMNSHSGLKPHTCNICFKGFNQISNLKDHLRTHNGEKPFLCSTCGKGFNQLGNLRQHTIRHSGVKAHLCSTCGNGFASKGELTAHLRKHTGARPFVCHICNHGFTTSSSLTKHKRIHSGEKPYECETCKMKFSRSGILARHKRTHTGVKPYKCNFCTKAFSQSNDLTSHLRIHTGEKPYICDECGHTFRQSSALKTHKKIHLDKTNSKTVDMKPLLMNRFLPTVL